MAENTNIGLTVEAWAKIVIERWEAKIKALKIGQTSSGKLLASILANDFSKQIQRDANGNPEKIVFAFEYYGKFVDMGVGRGVKMDDVDNGKNYRKRKPWYSPVFFGQVKELANILAEKYAFRAQLGIVTNVERFNGAGQQISESHTKIDRSDKTRKLSAREYDKLHGN